MESFNSLMLLLLILAHFFTQLGGSIPVSTIYSPDGDVIDCINRADQRAFDHPLLRNHILKEYPTGMKQIGTEVQTTWQVWHETGEECPAGTIPVRRELDQNITHKKTHPTVQTLASRATSGHKYAIGFMVNRQKIYGTRATLNVWAPVVESFGDFSLAQIWVASGLYNTADLNTVEAGWQADAYNLTGCYGIDQPGFVQTSSTIAIGAAISRTSTFGGNQLDITLQIWKDPLSGNWWLGLGHNTVPVGYWPAAIFTGLSDHATTVEWGGEVLYRNLSGLTTKAQMGSGEYANRGYGKAAYFCNLKVAENNHSLLPVQDFGIRADYPQYFTIKKLSNSDCGNHFYYGGPGPQSSGAVCGTLVSSFGVVYMSLLCLVLFFELSCVCKTKRCCLMLVMLFT